MWRPLLIALTACLFGCSGEKDAQRSSERQSASPTPAETEAAVDCSSARENIAVRDLTGRPKGYELVEMERDRAELIAGQFRRGLGDRFKSYDVRILTRKGASTGTTAVFVFNVTEPAGSEASEEIARGAQAAQQGTNRQSTQIEVGGKEGTLIEAADGAFIAITPARECSFAVLIADTEAMLRRGASLIPPG